MQKMKSGGRRGVGRGLIHHGLIQHPERHNTEVPRQSAILPGQGRLVGLLGPHAICM